MPLALLGGMKQATKKHIFGLLILTGLLHTVHEVTIAAQPVKKGPKINFDKHIRSARSEEKELLQNFKVQISDEAAPNAKTKGEVIEFLNSEIHWPSPDQNAKN